jgi:hypothetical protein
MVLTGILARCTLILNPTLMVVHPASPIAAANPKAPMLVDRRNHTLRSFIDVLRSHTQRAASWIEVRITCECS